MTTEAMLQEIMDRIKIRERMSLYLRGLDRRDFDLIRQCYTPDAYCDYSGRVAHGIDEIIEVCRSVLGFQVTTVFMGNQIIELKGDTADVETYAIDYLRYTKGGQDYDMWGALRYYDTFVRVDGDWKIGRRVQYTDWRRYDPVTTPP